jgi:hypothetical protein
MKKKSSNIAKNNPDWILSVYNKTNGNVKLFRRIMNRTEHEANKEAMSFMENNYPDNDWSIDVFTKKTDSIAMKFPEL